MLNSLAFIYIPLLAALAIAFAPKNLSQKAGFIAQASSVALLILSIYTCFNWSCACWDFSVPVLTTPKINLSVGFADGMSVIMVLLTAIVTTAAVFSGKAPEGREKLYYASSLLIAAGAFGAFLAKDLFFFYAFHELALIPTFLMIGLLGRGDRREAAWKITIYLGLGSIILLAGLLWLASAANSSFDLQELTEKAQSIPLETQKGIAGLLIIGFGTLISLFPFHSWAAQAYASAPAPTAMLHAGVLKKFGLYGLLRIGYMMIPAGMQAWLTPLIILLLCNIIWVGYVTINQKRLDTMLGNSSVMHMGYIFLAIAALLAGEGKNTVGLPAAVLLMFGHGVTIALLFSLADKIERRTGTLDLTLLGGLARKAPALAFLFGLAGMASIGLPGLANFAGEVMVFIAGFQNYDPAKGFGPVQIATIIAIWGVVISAIYMLRAYKNTFQGPLVKHTETATDLTWKDRIPAFILVAPLLIVGIYPNILLNLL